VLGVFGVVVMELTTLMQQRVLCLVT